MHVEFVSLEDLYSVLNIERVAMNSVLNVTFGK